MSVVLCNGYNQSFQLDLTDKVIAMDGKTSCRSFDDASRALHMGSAFVSDLGITLGQLRTSNKSNEITAMPVLLELLDMKNAVVIIDTMGCQTKIAATIIFGMCQPHMNNHFKDNIYFT